MKQKKILAMCLTAVMSVSMLFGCGNSTSTSGQNESTTTESNATTDDKSQDTDKNQADAEQLMIDLTGSYQELWPVLLDEKYHQVWIDDCTELVGEENAEAAYEKLASMVSGTVYGGEAVEAYKDGNGVYDCSFTEGVNTLEFDGSDSRIKGYEQHNLPYRITLWK